LAKVKMIVD